MAVKVRLYSVFASAAGLTEAEIELAERCTLAELLSELFRLCSGQGLKERVLGNEGALNPSCVILVNGRNAELLGGLQTVLSDGDEVWILPPLSGG